MSRTLSALWVTDARASENHNGELGIKRGVSPHTRLPVGAVGVPAVHDLQHSRRITRDPIDIKEALVGVF